MTDGGNSMRRWRRAARTACGVGLLLLGLPAAASAAPCDEYDPTGPARSARITLDASDLVDERSDEMRSFVATGSLGKVEAAIVSSTPKDAVHRVSAAPQVSRFTRDHGEQLKGIAVTVSLRNGAGPAKVVVNLRQVCAQYFRNTFLYY
ncbi:MAG TPA: hypothetical protein VGQ90_07925 [Stellaceae bacterium]|nr:hypothetical protein [Stellaceae bacterium]